MIDDKHYSVNQVAEKLNVQPQLVYKWIHQGKLSAVKLGGSVIRISEKELISFYIQSHSFGAWEQ
ncbi:helix-turn-helix domain-containing protein [Brevibacillus parabrevis]|uniref:helix-turn-helix domain-containing protein n=1 Tax=Brevibacillus parabrevis TaxID=54914 RepID=UPI002E1E305F|nr:helix-turn-helix domain-containing protein [Brevibacillus parabrevis]